MSHGLYGTKRYRWMVECLMETWDVNAKNFSMDEALRSESIAAALADFFEGRGPARLLFYYQPLGDEPGEVPHLFLTAGDTDRLKARGAYFFRVGEAGKPLGPEADGDVLFGEVEPVCLEQLHGLMSNVLQPLTERMEPDEWGECDEEHQREFLAGLNAFARELGDSLGAMGANAGRCRVSPATLAALGTDKERILYFEGLFREWVDSFHAKFRADEAEYHKIAAEGPRAELLYWQRVLRDTTLLLELTRTADFQLVRSELAAQSKKGEDRRTLGDYRAIEARLADQLNEARDNVKYLSTLEPFIGPLYAGSLEEIVDVLPSLMNAIKMVHSISRYFNTSQQLNALFVKVTHQLLRTCKQRIQGAGADEVWTADPDQLLQRLGAALLLAQSYRQSFEATKAQVAELPRSRHWDFDETAIFQPIELFSKRIKKLVELFSTVRQFRQMEAHASLEGLEAVTRKFGRHLEEFRRKTPSLFDFQDSKLEKDYVEFMQKVQKLDSDLQQFIDAHFANIHDVGYSLRLLAKFEAVLSRESVLARLGSKYEAVLQSYGAQMDYIQGVFDAQKAHPPVLRAMPLDAGRIIWARHLFARLYAPIEHFPARVVASREMRRYIEKFNAVGQNLIVYELYFTQSWSRDVERAKICLQTTLLAVREENGVRTLRVNFDRDVQKLLREARALDREGIVGLPDSARLMLLQEERLSRVVEELEALRRDYERVLQLVKPKLKTVLRPHVEDLDLRLRPGLATLTWTSMNVESFTAQARAGITRFEQLLASLNDCIENRVDGSLRAIADLLLVQLPQDGRPMALEEFVEAQQSHIDRTAAFLVSKNVEVERAVDDLLRLVGAYELDARVEAVDARAARGIKQHFFGCFYQAVLTTVKRSLAHLKARVCIRERGAGCAPLFEVGMALEEGEVRLAPRLEQTQHAIGRAAAAMLGCAHRLLGWEQASPLGADAARPSLHALIAQDKEVVRLVLLLAGSIQSTRNRIAELLRSFESFHWLWTENVAERVRAFRASAPQLSDYEQQLRRFSALEPQLAALPREQRVGAMLLRSEDLLQALRTRCRQWKGAYCEELHARASAMLLELTEGIKNHMTRMQREVRDIDSLGVVMRSIEDVKREQAESEQRFAPLAQMYALVDAHLHGGAVDKQEAENRAMVQRKWAELVEATEARQRELQRDQERHLRTLKENARQLREDVRRLRRNFELHGPMVQGITPKEAADRLKRFENECELKLANYEVCRRGEELFGLQHQAYPELELTRLEIENLNKLYELYNDVNRTTAGWEERPWSEIQLSHFREWEDCVLRYADACARLPKGLKEWQAYKDLREKIENYKQIFPLLKELKEPMVKERHWRRIVEVSGRQLNFQQPDSFYFRELVEADFRSCVEEVEDVLEAAKKQDKIDRTRREIKDDWNTRQFVFKDWGVKRQVPILSGACVEEVMEKLEEDISTLSGLSAMRHVGPFKEEVQQLQEALSDMQATLDLWFKVQIMWTSLERVFTEGDISVILTTEAKKFAKMDKSWVKSIMEKAFEQKLVRLCCQNEVFKLLLPTLQEDLEQCQKQLEKYLELKRKAFPRFYFVSNLVLLRFLSQGSDPESVQEDFDKLFDAISRVDFEAVPKKTAKRIVAIKYAASGSEEALRLSADVLCADFIEKWLLLLEQAMQLTVRDCLREVHLEVSRDAPLRIDAFVERFAAQVALVGLQMRWTRLVQEALERRPGERNKAVTEAKGEVNRLIDELTELCRADLPSALDRQKVETLVTVMVYLKDVTNNWRFRDAQDFEWQKCTRVQWREEQGQCTVAITDWEVPYSNEYLGVKERLCITPLTDRCYITLAQAMSMHYGGAPAGPAGTGKTETVKDLGRTLGIFVVLTNCSKEHRYTDMAKIFKGLCQSGLWGCFDEFNLIELEVLSVVAMQVEAITSAKKAGLAEFLFTDEAEKIRLVPTCGYFITMNPGYAGRQELPENLKVLFRGVTMMVPDREVIIRVKLASCGYKEYAELAKKFKVLYGLCEEQLSRQKHYDFGLRNILSVLRTMGNTLRSEAGQCAEEVIMMRTLRDMNVSKLVPQDIPLFDALLRDIFPRLGDAAAPPQGEMARRLTERIEAASLVCYEPWLLKAMQLYETSLVRHGIMVLGPTCSGKSTLLAVLLEAMQQEGRRYVTQRINPKAFTSQEMYGVKNIAGEWTPGIFSEIWRKANEKKPSKPHVWLVCDGPVDSLWIENMNSVLDDNKVLTLANGDRIFMQDSAKLIFEVENLNNASPATVSRCGQIFVSAADLGIEQIVRGWLAQRTRDGGADKHAGEKYFSREEERRVLALLLRYVKELNVIEAFERLTAKNRVIAIEPALKALQVLRLLGGLLAALGGGKQAGRHLSDDDYERVIVFALLWGVAGSFEARQRAEFVELLRAAERPVPLPPAAEPEAAFDFQLAAEDRGIEWRAVRPEAWRPPADLVFSRVLLPTVDSTRVELLLNLLAATGAHTLLVGGSGTAKTSSVLMYLAKCDPGGMLVHRINFSSATLPAHFQTAIESVCETKIRKGFGPKDGKLMTVFIDDVSMPECNGWGDQPTLEIVRQLIEDNGFYRLEKNERGNFKYIENLRYVAAMGHPGGGRNDIPNRLKHHFFTVNMTPPARIDLIFDPIVKSVFRAQPPDAARVVEALSAATLKLWARMKSAFLPTPAKFHYLFNLRDVSRLFKGVCQARPEALADSAARGLRPALFLVALWKHEAERVFLDKLMTVEDKQNGEELIRETCVEAFGGLEPELEALVFARNFNFCDFMRAGGEEPVEPAARVYEPVGDLECLRAQAEALLRQYNEANPQRRMDLVLFDDALAHLLRVCRLIQMPRSSALLVGVGGSGKQSLARLAAFIAGQAIFQIQLKKSYNESSLKEDLKGLFDVAGHRGQPLTFVLTDVEVKAEGFLEYINMVLSTGEVPGLIPKDDKEVWMGDVRADYVKQFRAQGEPSAAEVYDFFRNRLRDNLHVVLCFSPVGPKFRDRARKFPALFNECSIDWFLPWPQEALRSVARESLAAFEQLEADAATRQALERWIAGVHTRIRAACDEYLATMRRSVFVTPKSFLTFLKGYKALYARKFGELSAAEENFRNGLQKIKEAREEIEVLDRSLKREEEKVRVKKEEVEGIIAELNGEREKANRKNEEVASEKAKIEAEKRQIEGDKEICERELRESLPALERAQAAANQVSAKEISDLKPILAQNAHIVMKYVVDAIQVVLYQRVRNDVVMLDKPLYASKKQERQNLIEFFQDSWDLFGKQAFFEPSLAEKLQMMARTENENLINGEILELLEPYTRCAGAWLSKENAMNAFNKMGLIHDWIVQIEKFSLETRNIKPKRLALKQAEDKLGVASARLHEAELQLAAIQAKCDALDATYKLNNDEKNELEEQARRQKKKIDQANRLLNSLGDERERWSKGASELSEYKRRLVGNVGLATAFISYCGPFNAEFRDLIASERLLVDLQALGLAHSPGIYGELTGFLADEATVGQWNIDGLPKDVLSTQNGIMVEASDRFPLLIDPQGQGTAWIKTRFREVNPETGRPWTLSVNLSEERKFREGLARCIENGEVLIVEGVEGEVDPVLDPVLEKQLVRKNNRLRVTLEGATLDYDPRFRLFLTCRLGNPHFSPELFAKTTVIDFTVTQTGLEQQLLSVVLTKKQRALEDSLNTLLREVTTNKKELKKLDETLLHKLSNAEKNLLDDESLVEILNSTKTQAKEMQVKLLDAETKTAEINEKRSIFRAVAVRGSVLYFCMIDIAQVNWMYNSSLAQFLTLYNYSIDSAPRGAVPAKDVELIARDLTANVCRYVGRGLFERDKLPFLLMLCFKILLADKKLAAADVTLFLRGGASIDRAAARPKPGHDWLSDRAWLNLCALAQHAFPGDVVPFFKAAPDALGGAGAEAWRKWAGERTDPENGAVPELEERLRGEAELGAFLRLCLVRCLREDRTTTACARFVEATLADARLIAPEADSLQTLYQASSPREPILFLLSAGADPTNAIDELSRKRRKRLEKVSLGEGQERKAEAIIAELIDKGHWVLLQNCHLGLGYMARLENQLADEEFIGRADPEFRIWLSCEPRDGFPLGLLQRALKVTNEPPKGVKAGMLRTYATLATPELLERVDHRNWRALVFATAFLHSIVQERRKFGPLGWCVPYEFNASDLEASLAFVEKYLSQLGSATTVLHSTNYPLASQVLIYMICQIQYGGRVTDALDRETLAAYGETYFRDNIIFNEGVLARTAEAAYKLPDAAEHAGVVEHIKLFPAEDNPEVFGLNRSADLTYQLNASAELFRTITAMLPKDGGGGGGRSREEVAQQRAHERLSRLTYDYPEAEVQELVRRLGGPRALGERGMAVPLNVFLYQEIGMMRTILHIVRKTLTDIIEAVDGQIIMTPEIVGAIEAFDRGAVPDNWLRDAGGAEISWLRPTFGAWFDSLMERNAQLNAWLRGDRPRSFNLGLFFNPQGFLTAVKQEVVRANKAPRPGQKAGGEWSMDAVDFQVTVLSDKQQRDFDAGKELPAEGGVYIHGLFLEAARWSKEGLQDSAEKRMVFPLNVIFVTAVSTATRKGNELDKRDTSYSCPVYKYPIRNDRYLIFRIPLAFAPGAGDANKWRLRGVAILCTNNE